MTALEDLAATVVQVLAAAATGAGTGAAAIVGDLVRTRLAGSGQGQAVAEFEAAPQDPAAQAVLHAALVTVFTADQPFVVQVTASLPPTTSVPVARVVPAQSNSGEGITVQGNQNKVKGNFAGRDQFITNVRNGDVKTLAVLILVALVAAAAYGGRQLTAAPAPAVVPALPRIAWEAGPDEVGSPRGVVGTVAIFATEDSVGGRDSGTGKVLWTYRDGERRNRLYSTLDRATETVLVQGSGSVKALNPATGDAIWTYSIVDGSGTTGGGADMDLVGGTVYVCGFDTVAALVAATGQVLWTWRQPGPLPDIDSVETDGRTVIARTTVGGHATFFALDAEKGGDLWSETTPSMADTVTVVDGTVFLPAESGGTEIRTAATNTKRWQTRARTT